MLRRLTGRESHQVGAATMKDLSRNDFFIFPDGRFNKTPSLECSKLRVLVLVLSENIILYMLIILLFYLWFNFIFPLFCTYRKIPKISPSKYKPPKPVTQKTPPLNCPSKYKPPPGGGLYLENCPQIQSKTKRKR